MLRWPWAWRMPMARGCAGWPWRGGGGAGAGLGGVFGGGGVAGGGERPDTLVARGAAVQGAGPAGDPQGLGGVRDVQASHGGDLQAELDAAVAAVAGVVRRRTLSGADGPESGPEGPRSGGSKVPAALAVCQSPVGTRRGVR